ncbi:MAG: PEP-CTERM sorting domain-containing protein [Candidatus Thiodiazotropha sp. 6PLUC3]
MKFGIPLIAATGLAALFHITSAQAIPLYYSFEGSVETYPISDESGFLSDIGLAAGDSVSYTFMVDKDRQGSHRNEFGDLDEDQDTVRTGSRATNYFVHDSFYVELVESSVFDLVQGLYPDRGDDEPWIGSGYENSAYRNGLLEPGYSEVSLEANSASLGSSSMYVYSDMTSWLVGSTISADNSTNLYGSQAGDSSTFRSRLTLTGISEDNPANQDRSLVSGISGGADDEEGTIIHEVPEPSTFLLLGLGLLSIGAGRFKKLGRS